MNAMSYPTSIWIARVADTVHSLKLTAIYIAPEDRPIFFVPQKGKQFAFQKFLFQVNLSLRKGKFTLTLFFFVGGGGWGCTRNDVVCFMQTHLFRKPVITRDLTIFILHLSHLASPKGLPNRFGATPKQHHPRSSASNWEQQRGLFLGGWQTYLRKNMHQTLLSTGIFLLRRTGACGWMVKHYTFQKHSSTNPLQQKPMISR